MVWFLLHNIQICLLQAVAKLNNTETSLIYTRKTNAQAAHTQRICQLIFNAKGIIRVKQSNDFLVTFTVHRGKNTDNNKKERANRGLAFRMGKHSLFFSLMDLRHFSYTCILQVINGMMPWVLCLQRQHLKLFNTLVILRGKLLVMADFPPVYCLLMSLI